MRINEIQNRQIVVGQLNTARTNPFFVARASEVTADELIVESPQSIIFNEEGTSMNLMPLHPLGANDEEYSIPRSMIVAVAAGDEQFENAWNRTTSGIQIANGMPPASNDG